MKTLRQLLNVTRLAVCASFALAALAAYADDLAQDAFYIYRNDGDFNGFFYDEVLKMEYSRFDLDSVEHSEFVVQDIVTADSTYRIPLAAIDSIGFQQPEIKFNPKVKFVERDGLSDYLMYTSRESPDKDFVMFYNLPEDKRPKIGDIIIGLPTDAIANRYGSAYGGGLGGGSFSCVVTEIRDVTEGYFQGETYV